MAKRGGAKTGEARLEMVAFAAGLDQPQIESAWRLLVDLEHPRVGVRRSLYVLDPVPGTEQVKTQATALLFPEAQLALRNLYAALPGGAESDLYRDGFEMLCLQSLLRRTDLDAFVLVRGACDLGRALSWIEAGPKDSPYQEMGPKGAPERAIAFRAGHPALPRIAEIALDLYQTGAVLGFADYSLSQVLALALDLQSS